MGRVELRRVARLTAFVAIAAVPAAAQERPPAISLPEAIKRSEQVQPRVIQATSQVLTADARLRATRGAWFPNLSFSTSASNFFSEGQRVDPTTGQIVTSGSSNTSLSGSVQTQVQVFDGFRRSADGRAARANQQSALESLDDARFQQRLITTNQYFDVLAALQLTRVREQSIERATEQLRVSIARLEAGAAIKADTLSARGTLGNLEYQLVQAQTQLATAEANLGRLVGSDGPVTAIEDSTLYLTTPAIDPQALRAEAVSRSPQVRAAEASVRAARANVGVAKAGYWPTINLSGSASLNGSQQNDFNFLQQRNVQLQLSYPLFDRFQREQQIATQQANANSTDAQAAETRRAVQTNLTTRLAELRGAEKRIAITATSIAAATENLRVMQERYRVGLATIVDVMTVQESLTQAEVDRVNARFDYLRAKAQIEALIGREL